MDTYLADPASATHLDAAIAALGLDPDHPPTPQELFADIYGMRAAWEDERGQMLAAIRQAHQALLGRVPGSVPGGEQACEALLQVLIAAAKGGAL